MQLSKQALDEFKKLYLDKFNVELSDDEANKKGIELLEFFKVLYKPIPKEFKSQTS